MSQWLRLLFALFGALALGMVQTAQAMAGEGHRSDRAHCDGALKQGGLVICKAAPGTSITIDGTTQIVGETGLVTFGLSRSAPERVAVFKGSSLEPISTLGVEERIDPVRRIEGLDCDKVDARTDAQKAHASRSWVKKVESFAEFAEDGVPTRGFIVPAQGRPSSPFGPARTYVGISAETGEPCEKTSVHRGYDIAAPVGTDIVAPAAGTVILADDDLYYEGGTVFLDHGAGLVSVFMHMSAIDVTAGSRVETGDRLGAVGNTGRTTGPHLHWAVKWRDSSRSDRDRDFYIDPELLLELDPSVWSGTTITAATENDAIR